MVLCTPTSYCCMKSYTEVLSEIIVLIVNVSKRCKETETHANRLYAF